MQILEKNQVRLAALREKTEDKLRDRLVKYDEKLKDLNKRVEAYKTIGVSRKNFVDIQIFCYLKQCFLLLFLFCNLVNYLFLFILNII